MSVDDCWVACLGGGDIAKLECLVCVFQALVNVAVRVGGLLVLVMFLIGGFKHLTAGGDAKKAAAAWNTLTFAVLGLVLMILAWFIMLFLARFTGQSKILWFKIGT